MKKISEFIDTYSDDILYLITLRDSHLTHPGKQVYKPLFEASLARLFCIIMVGSIESMLENWRKKDKNDILSAYFQKASNEHRIEALIKNFKSNDIEVDEEILKQYLAIKYLRNTIIHSNWNKNNVKFIEQYGFPTDTRNLTNKHLQIMYSVNSEMMKYIASTEHNTFMQMEFRTELPEYQKYFNKYQFMGFLWNNLEKIDCELIYGSTITKDMIIEAMYDWQLYKYIAIDEYIDYDQIDVYTNILQKLIKNKQFSTIPIGVLNLDKIESDELNNTEYIKYFEQMLNMTQKEIIPFIESYKQGKRCYDRVKNNTISSLFNKFANLDKCEFKDKLEVEIKMASKMFLLGRLYYDYSEKKIATNSRVSG